MSDVNVTIGGEMDALRSELSSLHSDIQSWGNSIKNIGITAFLAWGSHQVFEALREQLAGLKDELKEWLAAAIEAEQVDKQLAAAVKATGMAAGFTAEALGKEASALQRMSTFGDEAIKTAQTLLLKFKEIKGDEFKRAEMLMIDMASRMGTDVVSAAESLGRALNNPARGIMLLQREGIKLSDVQKELVQYFMDTGRAAEAQKIILQALEDVYAGSNAAAVDTLGGQLKQLKEEFGDVREELGMKFLPVARQMVDAFKKDVLPTIHEVITRFGDWKLDSAQLNTFTGSLKDLVKSLGDLALSLKDNFIPIVKSLIGAIKEALDMLPNSGHAQNQDEQWLKTLSESQIKQLNKAYGEAFRKDWFYQQQDALRGVLGEGTPVNKQDFLDLHKALTQELDRRAGLTRQKQKDAGIFVGDEAPAPKKEETTKSSEPKMSDAESMFRKAFPGLPQNIAGLKEIGSQFNDSLKTAFGGAKDLADGALQPIVKNALDLGTIVHKNLTDQGESFKAQKLDAVSLFNKIQLAAASRDPEKQTAEKQLTVTEQIKENTKLSIEATKDVGKAINSLVSKTFNTTLG